MEPARPLLPLHAKRPRPLGTLFRGCNGRCGGSCGAWGDGYGLYTLDCLDHDEAVEAHGYFSSYVQDEFANTYDDAYLADYYWYYKCIR